MFSITPFSRIVREFSRPQASSRILLLSLTLGATPALACDDDGPLFAPMAIALLVLEAIFIALAGFGWWLKHRFWPQKSGERPKPWFFLLSCAAALTSLFSALIGVLYIPAFRDFYIGMGSDLPPATRLVIKGSYALGLVPLATGALWWAFRNASRRSLYVAVMCIAELGVLLGVLWAAAGFD